MTRTTGASVDTYSYQGTTNAVVRIANTGGTGVITDSIPDPAGDRLGTRTGSVVAWLMPDLHGSVAAGLAQTPSSVSDAIRYDGYGQTVAVWPTSGSPATASWKYQGRLDLSPSSIPLYDAGARDYAPGLGIFTGLDTVAGSAQDPLSMNRFLYAEANPATLVDPSGHCPFCIVLIPIAIGFFAGAATDAVVQQVTTGDIDWRETAVSGVIGGVSGGVGGVAASGARVALTSVAKPIVTRVVSGAAGALAQTATEETINQIAVTADRRDSFAQNLTTSVATSVGTDLALEAAARLPGRLGAVGRIVDNLLGGGGDRHAADEPPWIPDASLPRSSHGDPLPSADVPHSQLGRRVDAGHVYRQARTWEIDAQGRLVPTRDIDFTDHGAPDLHPNPHQHILTPNNPAAAPRDGYRRGMPLDL